MAVTRVGAGAGSSGAATITPALPASIQANDILLMVCESANQAVTISNQAGGTWTEVTNSPQGTGTAAGASSTRVTVFWSRYNGTQTAPTLADAGDHVAAVITAFRGCKTSGDPWNVTSGNVITSATTALSATGATTSVANCMVVICACLMDDAQSFGGTWTNADLTGVTNPTSFGHAAGNDGRIGVTIGTKATAGAYGATTNTLSAASVMGLMTIALEPAPTGYTLVAEAGSYAATGTAAGVLLGHLLSAAAGSYAVSGTDAGTFKGAAVIAEAGSYAVTGSEAVLTYTPSNNKLIVADPGSYGITGTDASLELGRLVTADAGSYSVTGTDASLLHAKVITSESGSYVQTGTDASTLRGYAVSAGAGAYVLTGQDAQLVYEPATGYVLGAAAGSYAVTGTDASTLHGSLISAASGSYSITGSTADFLHGLLGVGIPTHYLSVPMGGPHQASVSMTRRQGSSIMDTYRTSSTRWRTSNDHLRTSDAPMRYT